MSGGVTEGPQPAPPRDARPSSSPVEPTSALGEPSDHELLDAHVEGDPNAFSTLVGRHADRLWAIALRVMGNPDDAADALQDAYVAAFRRAGTFRGDAQVTTWLHRVVVNASLDRLRRAKVRSADPLPDDLDRVGSLAREQDRDPVEEQEQRDEIADALATLNPDQRAALVLVDMQGYSVDEAAALLDCAPGTVKSRCARGRARLVPLLAHLREPEVSGARAGGTPRAAPRTGPPPDGDERPGAPP